MTENYWFRIVSQRRTITLIGDAAHPMSPFKGQEQIKRY
jgi:2-polyprenyl-6-methoxyphenol hydroxylase-like FAD-dependent oxidoreductase